MRYIFTVTFSRDPPMLRTLRDQSLFSGIIACVCLAVVRPGLEAQQVACAPGEPNVDAPDGIRQFHFLIGQFDIRGRRWMGEEWSPPGPLSYWEG